MASNTKKKNLSTAEKVRLADLKEQKTRDKEEKKHAKKKSKLGTVSKEVISESQAGLCEIKSQVHSSLMDRMIWEEEVIQSIPKQLDLFEPSFVPSSKPEFEDIIRPGISDGSLLKLLVGTINDFLSKDNAVQDAIREFKLSALEARCVLLFTMEATDVSEIHSTHNSFYRAYNTALRKRDKAEIFRFQDYSLQLQSALSKLPRVGTKRDPVTLYRGIDKRVTELSKQYKVDSPVVWVAYSSFSKNSEAMSSFGKGTRFEAKVIGGYDISRVSFHRGEEEVLLPPNSSFRVKKVLPADSDEIAIIGRVSGAKLDYDIISMEQFS